MEKAKPGRKDRYDELCGNEKLESVRGWALHGGKKAVAKALGVGEATVRRWELKYPAFAAAVRAGVQESNGELLTSAFDMARGYYREVTEIVKVKKQRVDKKTGKTLVNEIEKVVKYQKYFPPDPRMTQFLLSNRLRNDYQKAPEPEENPDNKRIEFTFGGSDGEEMAK